MGARTAVPRCASAQPERGTLRTTREDVRRGTLREASSSVNVAGHAAMPRPTLLPPASSAMRTLALAACFLLTAAASLTAQKKERVPDRPRLHATADTNDPWAYYNDGLQRLIRFPDQAADAFYWASRLAPTWGEPYYARRAALHLEDKNRLYRYLTGQRGTVRSSQVRAIDSLATEAMLRQPFFSPRFDRLLTEETIRHISNGQAFLDRMRTGDPGYDASMAFADGKLEEAVRLYAEALKRRPKDFGYRAPRARAFYLMLKYDSAASELTKLLVEMRKKDEKTLVYFYDSKAIFEYSLARTYYQLEQYDSARVAYGRALEEDLSFHVAHRDLAEIAFKQGDTTTAVAELALAAQLRPGDAGTRLLYGDALAVTGSHDEAEAEYQAAIAEEPYFALPYFQLARLYDARGKAPQAIEQYRAFVARSARNRDEVPLANKRIGELTHQMSSGAPPEPRS